MLLCVFGLTGSVLVFYEEIDGWLEPALHRAPAAPPGASRRTADELLEAGLRAAPPGWRQASLALPREPGRTAVVSLWYDPPSPPPEEAVSFEVALDPATGAVVARRTFYHAWNPLRHCFVGFFFKLHYALLLTDWAGNVGNTVVAGAALVLLFSLLTGLVLFWPLDGRWRRVLTVKRGAGPVRWNHDLHQVAGWSTAVVLLAVLVSGVYFNLPDEFRWAVERFSPLTPEATLPPAPRGVGPGTIEALAASLGSRAPGGALASVAPSGPDGALVGLCWRDLPELRGAVDQGRCLTADRRSGEVLRVSDARAGTRGDSFLYWQWPLHSGKAFGWPGRFAVFLAGLACPLLFATGVIRWWQKRRSRLAADGRGIGSHPPNGRGEPQASAH